jgi:hypothetical protein
MASKTRERDLSMTKNIKATIDLRALHAVCECAASKEETRYYLNGVLIEVYNNQNVYVATDGHRLVAHRQTFPDASKLTELLASAIIPAEECKALKPKSATRNSYSATNHADLTFEPDGYLRVQRQDGTARLFRPIDGTFPDWRRVMPTKLPETVQIECANAGKRGTDGKLICSRPAPKLVTINQTQGGFVVLCECGGMLSEISQLAQFNWEYTAAFSKFAERMDLQKPAIVHNGNGPAVIDFDSKDTFGVLMPLRTGANGRSFDLPAWVKAPALGAAAAA